MNHNWKRYSSYDEATPQCEEHYSDPIYLGTYLDVILFVDRCWEKYPEYEPGGRFVSELLFNW